MIYWQAELIKFLNYLNLIIAIKLIIFIFKNSEVKAAGVNLSNYDSIYKCKHGLALVPIHIFFVSGKESICISHVAQETSFFVL